MTDQPTAARLDAERERKNRKIADAYERGARDERERIVALAREHGAMYPRPCPRGDCPNRTHGVSFARLIESETP